MSSISLLLNMKTIVVVFLVFLSLFGAIKADVVPEYEIEEPLLYDTFPEGFLWGTATAAYQVNKVLFYRTSYLKNSDSF